MKIKFNLFFKRKITSTGRHAEKIARNYLEKEGLIFIAENYRCRWGEIDLIMRDKTTMVFVEVRYRASNRYGSSAESVTYTKQRKLIISAEHFLASHPVAQQYPCRFDVMALCQDPKNAATLHIDWIKHAFSAF